MTDQTPNLPNEILNQELQHYANVHQARMAALRQARDFSQVPSLTQVYQQTSSAVDAQFAEHQKAVAEGPYAFRVSGPLRFAPGSKFAPSKDELVNGSK